MAAHASRAAGVTVDLLRRLALVHAGGDGAMRAARLAEAAARCGFAAETFARADQVDAAAPDLVICLSGHFAKLWRAPSLLVLAGGDLAPFHDGAALVRIMSHDGWLVEQAGVERRLRDLVFALRKDRPLIAPWYDCLPLADTADPVLASAAEPGRLLAALAAGRPVLADAAHPYLAEYSETLQRISLDVPEPVVAAQIAALGPPDGARLDAARQIYLERHSPEAQIRALAARFPRFLSERGYRPAPPALDIAYIMRAGRPDQLPRALVSLAAQGIDRLRVVLVVWRRIEALPALLASVPRLDVSVIDAPGARRSAALWRGLAAVAAMDVEWFGILDDDDELLPQHLSMMAVALERSRGEAEPPPVLHAAVLRRAEAGFTAPAELEASPVADEAVRLQGFEIQDPVRLARHRHIVASQSYIARTALLDAETLEDPGLDLAEDAYLFKLLCLKGLPRFVPEVTSVVHDGAADQSGFARSLATAAALERISFRLLGRRFPYRSAFGEPGPLDPLGVAVPLPMAEGVAGIPPRVLALSQPADGTSRPFPCTGGALRVTAYGRGAGGPYRLGYRAGDRPLAACTVATEPLAVLGFWRAGMDLGVPPAAAGEGHVVEIVQNSGDELLAITLENTGVGVEVAWTELPEGPIWIYGAGGAGERAADCLEAETGRRPAGFIDGHKRGMLRGVAIIGAGDVDRIRSSTIIIASQYVVAIMASLRAHECSALFSAYPMLDHKLSYFG